MRYTATVDVHTENDVEASNLSQLLQIESKEGENDRGSFTARKEGKDIIVQVNATDSVALRATLVSVTKILTVHEKVNQK